MIYNQARREAAVKMMKKVQILKKETMMEIRMMKQKIVIMLKMKRKRKKSRLLKNQIVTLKEQKFCRMVWKQGKVMNYWYYDMLLTRFYKILSYELKR